MMIHGAKLQHKQGFLFRIVDIANELFAMTATISRARSMAEAGLPEAANAGEVAELFSGNAARKVRKLFRELWVNDDMGKYRVALSVLRGDQLWMEQLLEGLPRTAVEKRATPLAA